MEDKRPTPPQWLAVMEPRGIHSAQRLADVSGVAVQTVIRLIHNEGGASRSTLAKVGKVLKLRPEELLALRGETALPPFVLPPEADQLDDIERDTVRRVVKSILRAKETAAAADELAARRAAVADPRLQRRAARAGIPERIRREQAEPDFNVDPPGPEHGA